MFQVCSFRCEDLGARANKYYSGKQFDVEGAILATLKNLLVDLAVTTSLKLDDFPTELAFNQTGVPAIVSRLSASQQHFN